jgi:hypothetical protein
MFDLRQSIRRWLGIPDLLDRIARLEATIREDRIRADSDRIGAAAIDRIRREYRA